MQIFRTSTSILRDAGLEPTPARVKILDICLNSDLPLEVSEVASSVGRHAHLATVYRTLEKLVTLGILVRVDFHEGKFRYEFPRTHHHHAICESCGKIEDIKNSEAELTSIEKSVTSESGFVVSRHVMELFGLCNKCQKMGAPQ